jgi:hypothetical protein
MGKSGVDRGFNCRLKVSKVLVEDKSIPPNAVPFGEDRNGQTLFIARVHLEVRLTQAIMEFRPNMLTFD